MKRIMILLILIAIALVAVLGRLVYIQVVRGGEFTDKAAQMMHFVEPLEARRGRILDRFGGMPGAAVLAFDEPCWDLGLDYRFLVLVAADRNWGVKVDTKFLDKAQRWKRHRVQEIAKADKVSSEEAEKVFAARAQTTMTWAGNAAEDAQTDLEAVMRRTIARVEHIRQMLRRREKGPPREEEWAHPVVRGLGAAMKVALDGHMADMVGAVIRDSHKRCYPHLDIACHVIGRTGPVDAAEQERYNLHDDADLASRIRTNYLDGDTIGKNGAELLYEDVLRGRRGYRKRNRYTGEVIEEVPAAEGKDVRLTIDLALQRRITEQFAGRRYTGAAAVIYVPTGEVLALVSYPTHDLNLFGREFEALAKDVIMLPMRHREIGRAHV
jgi:penicillin-binding protein 2